MSFAIHQVLSVATAVDSMLLQLSILAGGGGSSEEQARATARQLAPLYVDLTTVSPPFRIPARPTACKLQLLLALHMCACGYVCVCVCMREHVRVCGSGL